MKMIQSLMVASIAAISSGLVVAGPYSGDLAGFDNDTGTFAGSTAIAIGVTTQVRDAMQSSQFGAGDACIGNNSKTCMPSISSAELRAMTLGRLNDMAVWVAENENGTATCNAAALEGSLYEHSRCEILTTASGNRTNNRNFRTAFPAEVKAALDEFSSAGDCGQLAANGDVVNSYDGNGAIAGMAASLAATTSTSADVAAGFAAVSNRNAITAIPVTEINGSNGSTGLGFVKLDGHAPDLLEFMTGNYPLGQNIHGVGALPADETVAFGTVGVLAPSGSTPHHVNGGGFITTCAGLSTTTAAITNDN